MQSEYGYQGKRQCYTVSNFSNTFRKQFQWRYFIRNRYDKFKVVSSANWFLSYVLYACRAYVLLSHVWLSYIKDYVALIKSKFNAFPELCSGRVPQHTNETHVLLKRRISLSSTETLNVLMSDFCVNGDATSVLRVV